MDNAKQMMVNAQIDLVKSAIKGELNNSPLAITLSSTNADFSILIGIRGHFFEEVSKATESFEDGIKIILLDDSIEIFKLA